MQPILISNTKHPANTEGLQSNAQQASFKDLCDKTVEELLSCLSSAEIERISKGDAPLDVYHRGTEFQQDIKCIAIFQLFQDDTVPEATRSAAKALLMKFLDKMGLTDQKDLPCFARSHDSDLIFHYALKRFLCELSISCYQEMKEKAYPLYAYLKVHVADIDKQLLNNAIKFLTGSYFSPAERICNLLTHGENTDALPMAIELKKVLKERHKVMLVVATIPGMKEFMLKAAAEPGYPAAATWCGKSCDVLAVEPLEQVQYLSQAAIEGDSVAIYILNEKAAFFNELGTIEPLGDIYDPNAVIGREDWVKMVTAITTKIKRAIEYSEARERVFQKQTDLCGVKPDDTFEQRMAKAEAQLKIFDESTIFLFNPFEEKATFEGVEILVGLSTLVNHPLASTSGQILAKWLEQGSNRIWLIRKLIWECAVLCKDINHDQMLIPQINSFFEQLRFLKEKGEVAEVLHQVHQFIDMTTALVHQAKHVKAALIQIVLRQIYPLLLSANVISDQDTINEINAHKALCHFKKIDGEILASLFVPAQNESRPLAGYLYGVSLCPYVELASRDDILKASTYIRNAGEAKFEPANKWLDSFNSKVKAAFLKAERRAFDLFKGHTKTLELYEFAGKAGHREAYLKYLELYCKLDLSPRKEFELGELYFTGKLHPFPAQDIERAKKLMEDAATKGDVRACLFLAHKFSPKIKDQPKFTCTDYFIYKKSEKATAQEYLAKAISSHIKQGRNLSDILAQIDPVFNDDIFALSEDYRNELKNSEDADTLLDWAVDKESDAACDKKFALLNLRKESELSQQDKSIESISSTVSRNNAPSKVNTNSVEIKPEPLLSHKNVYTHALYDSGMALIRGTEVPRNLLQGLDDLKTAAILGDEIAQAALDDTSSDSPILMAAWEEIEKMQNSQRGEEQLESH